LSDILISIIEENKIFKQIDKKTVIERIRDQILSLIYEGKLLAGNKLPSETELMKIFGVSRPAVREAIHVMIGEGILEIKHGKGTYVRELSSASAIKSEVVNLLLKSANFEEILDVLEVRATLEPAIAARVAQYASAEDFEDMEKILDQCEEAIHKGDFNLDMPWNFHKRVSEAAGNSIMAKMLVILYEMIKAYEVGLYDIYFDPMEDLAGHRKLLEEIKSKDPERARKAMLEHFEDFKQNLTSALQIEKEKSRSNHPD